MYEHAPELITTLIDKTKNHILQWVQYGSNKNNLKPEKTNLFNNETPNSDPIVPDDSYTADCDDIFFFLLVRTDALNLFGTYLTLYVQTNSSAHSKFCASTLSEDEEIVSELKRLYNLIESIEDPIDESIRAFIGK